MKRWRCYLCKATGTGRDAHDARRGFADHYMEHHADDDEQEVPF